ncbi:MAG: PHP domain-containing protein [Candidatus Nanohaloarchaea archaeon]
MATDPHTHTTYSDGEFPEAMASAAEEHGLDGIGFADHLLPGLDERRQHYGMNMDIPEVRERRSEAIEKMRDEYSIQIWDAAEIDYLPGIELEETLRNTDFDYVLGSVHYLDGDHVLAERHFSGLDKGQREQKVDQYFDSLVDMVESELFDVAAHPDAIENNQYLEPLVTEEHYDRLFQAFRRSDTLPEINAAKALEPETSFYRRWRDEDLEFSFGTDAHSPSELEERNRLREGLESEPVPVEEFTG